MIRAALAGITYASLRWLSAWLAGAGFLRAWLDGESGFAMTFAVVLLCIAHVTINQRLPE